MQLTDMHDGFCGHLVNQQVDKLAIGGVELVLGYL